MADNLRGDGLVRVHRALDRLEADPLGRPNASQEMSPGNPPLYLAQILLNHYPRLLAYPHEEANG